MGVFVLTRLLQGGRRGGPEVSLTGFFFPAARESRPNVAAMLAEVSCTSVPDDFYARLSWVRK